MGRGKGAGQAHAWCHRDRRCGLCGAGRDPGAACWEKLVTHGKGPAKGTGERPGCWDMGPRTQMGRPASSMAVGHTAQGLCGAQGPALSLAPAAPALGPHSGRAAGAAPAQGCFPALGNASRTHPVRATMALRCDRDMLGWGCPVLAPNLHPLSQSPEHGLESLGRRSEGHGGLGGPSSRLQGVALCQGSLVPTKCPISERCAGSKGEQLMGAWGGRCVGQPRGPELLGSHLGGSEPPCRRPFPHAQICPFLRGEGGAGQPQGAFTG